MFLYATRAGIPLVQSSQFSANIFVDDFHAEIDQNKNILFIAVGLEKNPCQLWTKKRLESDLLTKLFCL